MTNLLIAIQGIEFGNILERWPSIRFNTVAWINYDCMLFKKAWGYSELPRLDFLVFQLEPDFVMEDDTSIISQP